MTQQSTPRRERQVSSRGRVTYFIPTEPHAIYRLYAADGILLYIGMSGNPEARIARHRTEQTWGAEIATWTVEWYETRRDADRAEQPAIDAELPCYGMTTDLYREISNLTRTDSSDGKQERIAEARERYRLYAIEQQRRAR